ncbi:unnamed protein product [Didymodactylos carnosus]|uniref:NAD(P)(+)--arginine ADP-ribosyltransferase n=1 Tax=Didymodactylos carnosus TaxID=1234261 RepID=A0A814ZBL1_9BILA|nr:unnamed protein product [Didymodactylos carnosus]CAF1241637.1 unnamed protein product [Didymodactylos carnosus]CAF3778462.1 unnamed protein product [Didymodactylos carnosus]CAF4004935.1 unnamed protein product [Didymodactylos carnosus]
MASLSTDKVQQDYNLENFVVIWLDQNNTIEDDVKDKLQYLVNLVKIFENIDECSNYISNVQTEKVFLIISSISLAEHIVPKIQHYSQLELIYVLSSDSNIEIIAKKVHHVYDKNSIFSQLQSDIIQSAINLNEINIINDISIDRSLQNNEVQLKNIKEFEEAYEPSKAIWWYTRDCFLYRILNKALRIQDIEILYRLRFFIVDLHKQLEKLQPEFIKLLNDMESTVSLYRGQIMTSDEFESKLKHNTGSLLSTTSFLSTTIDEELAKGFAIADGSSYTSILFKITLDTTIHKGVFAYIDPTVGSFDSENEVLFSMGTVFRIETVKKLDNDIWQVSLSMTNDEDQQLKTLCNHMRTELGITCHLASLGRLMFHMGNYDLAEQFNQLLLRDPTIVDPHDLGLLHNDLGLIYSNQADYTKAFEHFGLSLQIKKRHLKFSDRSVVTTLNNIGMLYFKIQQYETALSYFQHILQIDLHASLQNLQDIGADYNNIGDVYRKQRKYSKAIKMYQKAVDTDQQSLPLNHPIRAIHLNNIGLYYYNKSDYVKANDYYQKTLDIQLQSLPADHSHLATTYNNIAGVCYEQAKYDECMINLKKASEIANKKLPSNHPDRLKYQENIEILKGELESIKSYS